MKNLIKLTYLLLAAPILLSSCATLIGGSNYYAKIIVKDNPNAKIYYNDEFIGMGMLQQK
jgi:hypothetical protein